MLTFRTVSRIAGLKSPKSPPGCNDVPWLRHNPAWGLSMTCTKEQIRKFMKYRKTLSLEVAAAKAGMSENTARRYSKMGGKCLPKPDRDYRTRNDPFAVVWEQLDDMLKADAGLEAKTLLEWLQEAYPGQFKQSHLRTLQRVPTKQSSFLRTSALACRVKVTTPGATS